MYNNIALTRLSLSLPLYFFIRSLNIYMYCLLTPMLSMYIYVCVCSHVNHSIYIKSIHFFFLLSSLLQTKASNGLIVLERRSTDYHDSYYHYHSENYHSKKLDVFNICPILRLLL